MKASAGNSVTTKAKILEIQHLNNSIYLSQFPNMEKWTESKTDCLFCCHLHTDKEDVFCLPLVHDRTNRSASVFLGKDFQLTCFPVLVHLQYAILIFQKYPEMKVQTYR